MTISPDELAAALASQREDMIEAETRRIVKASERDGEGTLRPLFAPLASLYDHGALRATCVARGKLDCPRKRLPVIHSEPNIGKTLVMQYLMTRIALGRAAFPPKGEQGTCGRDTRERHRAIEGYAMPDAALRAGPERQHHREQVRMVQGRRGPKT